MSKQQPRRRIFALDYARAIALVGMAIYHFTYDLTWFGLVPPGTATRGSWAIFARIVAGSFIFIAGISLHLAHRDGLRLRAWSRRFAVLLAAAAAVSAATYLAIPSRFVYFGILHSIAFSGLVGLAFLRVPAPITLLAVLAVALAPRVLGGMPMFDTVWLAWLGLSPWFPPAVDYVPVFPWLAPFLAGMGVAKIADRFGIWERLTTTAPSRMGRVLAWPGEHSLVVYLVHQPVLIGLLYVTIWMLR